MIILSGRPFYAYYNALFIYQSDLLRSMNVSSCPNDERHLPPPLPNFYQITNCHKQVTTITTVLLLLIMGNRPPRWSNQSLHAWLRGDFRTQNRVKLGKPSQQGFYLVFLLQGEEIVFIMYLVKNF